MPRIETTLLGRTPSVRLHEVRCEATTRAAGDEEREPTFSVAFPLSGVYVHHWRHQRLVAAPGVALFMNRDDLHRTSHPAARGDRSVELSLSDEAAEPFTRGGTHAFPTRSARVPAPIDVEVRLHARRATDGTLDPLALEEWAFGVLERILDAAPIATGVSPRRRAAVDDAREYLGWHFAEDADLRTVAAHVGVSPHHLSRVFRAGTGTTLSAHRTELRLRAAVDRIASGATDLASVANDVGFFDHAHMTRTFRRALGVTPSQIRSSLSGGCPP
jgi:AraC family transcriptional regulator